MTRYIGNTGTSSGSSSFSSVTNLAIFAPGYAIDSEEKWRALETTLLHRGRNRESRLSDILSYVERGKGNGNALWKRSVAKRTMEQ